MHSHNGTWDFLKLVAIFAFIGLAVWWVEGAIGKQYTVLIVFALVGVILFAGGAMMAAAIQKNTLNSVTRFNADDAQIDKYRMQSFKAMATGESAMKRAAAQIQVINEKRVSQLATQQAKLLVDTERTKLETEWAQRNRQDAWADTDDDDADAGANFQQWS